MTDRCGRSANELEQKDGGTSTAGSAGFKLEMADFIGKSNAHFAFATVAIARARAFSV